jgi:2-keto-4-pentenoate hydratase/2-oxohepta-3-ene-1,7-dioic acid hydratase in catechol pathway
VKSIKFCDKTFFPTKVVCVGRNYVEHIKELNNEIPSSMVLFNKPNSSVTDELLYFGDNCRFEAEICFLIENNIISGIGFGLDLTKADIQNNLKSKGLPWERAKAFDNSAVFSHFIKLDKDIKNVKMQLLINDNLIQEATYDLMIYKPNEILSEILSFMSLEDGDIIMSGTPKGVGTYNRDDNFIGKIFLDNELVINKQFIVEGE